MKHDLTNSTRGAITIGKVVHLDLYNLLLSRNLLDDLRLL